MLKMYRVKQGTVPRSTPIHTGIAYMYFEVERGIVPCFTVLRYATKRDIIIVVFQAQRLIRKIRQEV